MRQKLYGIMLFLFSYLSVVAQNNVGIGTTTPDPSARLDVAASDKGILIPRVFLTNVNSASPVTSPTASLLVYNSNGTVTGGSGTGFYFWDGTKWQKLFSALDGEGWKLLGNAGTDPATHFIGTTDNQPLNFRVNNLRVGRIDPILFNTLLGAGTGINLAPTDAFNSRKNVFLGDSSGHNTVTGGQNTFVGYRSGHNNITGFNNTFIGHRAGTLNTASNNTFIGSFSGELNTTGNFNLFAGFASGQKNSAGSQNIFLGFFAGINNTTAWDNTFVGFRTGQNNTTAPNNTFIGSHAGFNNNTGQDNVFMGNAAGQENLSGRQNVFLGFSSGRSNTAGNDNVFIGDSAGYNNTTASFNTFIGRNAGLSNSTAERNSFIGYQAGRSHVAGLYNSFFGAYSGYSSSLGFSNTFIGDSAGYSNIIASFNTFVGRAAGVSNFDGEHNTYVGYEAGASNLYNSYNTSVGSLAGRQNMGINNSNFGYAAGIYNQGSGNSFFGSNAGLGTSGSSSGSENALFGSFSGRELRTGTGNSFFGTASGRNTTVGSYNVFVGDSSGYINGGGNHNTLMGAFTHLNGTGFVNASAIGSRARVDASNSMVLGSISGVNGATASVNVGIGLVAPARTLHVATAGSTGITPMPDAVIVAEKDNDDAFINILTDANRSSGIGFGNEYHAAHGGIVYNVGGNTYDLRFRTTGNIDRMTIDNIGQVGIGTTLPAHRLHVAHNDGGVDGFLQGIVVDATNTSTGEAAISFKNAGASGTGSKYWIVGLNQGRNLSFNYGTTFIATNTHMTLDTTGRLGIGTIAPAANLDVDGTTKIGSNGSVLNNIIKVTVNLDLDGVLGLAATASFTQTVAVANAVVGSTVHISPSSALSGGLVIAYARVSAANTVEIKVTNSGGGASFQAAMNVFITVIQ